MELRIRGVRPRAIVLWAAIWLGIWVILVPTSNAQQYQAGEENPEGRETFVREAQSDVGEQCVYQLEPSNPLYSTRVAPSISHDARVPGNWFGMPGEGSQIKKDEEWYRHSYSSHPLHDLMRSVRPGIALDAHSKALLRLDPSMQLVVQLNDSTYFARPGNVLVQLALEQRVRRSNLIPDTLFRIPEGHYVFGAQVTWDLFFGRLEAYQKESSRVAAVIPMRISGKRKIVVVISHDYLKGASNELPEISVAVFSPGLVFEDLIRTSIIERNVINPVPLAFGQDTLYWQSATPEIVGLSLSKAHDGACVPIVYVKKL